MKTRNMIKRIGSRHTTAWNLTGEQEQWSMLTAKTRTLAESKADCDKAEKIFLESLNNHQTT